MKKYTPEQRQQVAEYLANGFTPKEVAKAVGCSLGTVYYWQGRLNKPKRSSARPSWKGKYFELKAQYDALLSERKKELAAARVIERVEQAPQRNGPVVKSGANDELFNEFLQFKRFANLVQGMR